MAERNFRKLTDKLLDIIFPPRCAGCGEVIPLSSIDAFCPDCREKWEKHKRENCRRCGQPLCECWCGVSFDKKNDVTHEYHLVQYDKMANTVIKNLLYNMKYFNRSLVSDCIAKEMYNELYPRIDYTDLIITYVPRSPANIRKHGHDQSLNLARSFSELTGLEIAEVLGHRGNANQKALTPNERMQNAQRSYYIINGAGKLIKGRTVILIDDVLTTGSSLARCAHLLKWKGAERVITFTIAKTI